VGADLQAQIVYSILGFETAAFEGIAKKPLHLAHEIEKHGNTSISVGLYQPFGKV
jgi:hypothetical protein